MSRLFGFFSANKANLSCSQFDVKSEDADISEKSRKADGWGIGFFRNRASFLFKKAARSSGDQRITNISEVMSSNIFISHLRYASIGERKEANTQPFRWGNWIFAHQGTIKHFRKIRPHIIRRLPAAYKKQISGNTDSEYLFYLFLTMLRGEGGIKKANIPLSSTVLGLKKCVQLIYQFCDDVEAVEFPVLNLLISNGEFLLAVRDGSPLYYLWQENLSIPETIFVSYKTGLQYELKNIDEEFGFIIVASEKLTNSPEWKEIPDKNILTIDAAYNINVMPIAID